MRNCVLDFEDFIFQMIYWLYSENVYADITICFLVSLGPDLFRINNISTV